jgi:hypothetical protein
MNKGAFIAQPRKEQAGRHGVGIVAVFLAGAYGNKITPRRHPRSEAPNRDPRRDHLQQSLPIFAIEGLPRLRAATR